MSTRAERRKRVAARVAAGELPARRVTHFQDADIRTAVRDELDAHRVALANQRTRVRNAKLAAPKRTKSAAGMQADERRDALIEHLSETL